METGLNMLVARNKNHHSVGAFVIFFILQFYSFFPMAMEQLGDDEPIFDLEGLSDEYYPPSDSEDTNDDDGIIDEAMMKSIASDAQALADQIYLEDLSGFLALDPTMIAANVVDRLPKTGSYTNVVEFLSRIDNQSDRVVEDITKSPDSNLAFFKWKEVALQLFRDNDFFGYFCVTSGMDRSTRETIFDRYEAPNLSLPSLRDYLNAKRERRQQGIIPAIFREHGMLISTLEAIRYRYESLTDAQRDALEQEPIRRFVEDMRSLQATLRTKMSPSSQS